METLSTESEAYEDWKHEKLPHILEVFKEFPSCRPPAALFIANLTTLQPRFYSISSSQRKYPNEVHLTVAIVKYVTNGKFKRFSICLSINMKNISKIKNTCDNRWLQKRATWSMLQLSGGIERG